MGYRGLPLAAVAGPGFKSRRPDQITAFRFKHSLRNMAYRAAICSDAEFLKRGFLRSSIVERHDIIGSRSHGYILRENE